MRSTRDLRFPKKSQVILLINELLHAELLASTYDSVIAD
jgi:hypothetical protein